MDAGKLLSALMHACAALDGTASKLYPSETNNRNRFVDTFDRYLWVIEPMLAVGINLEETSFECIKLGKRPSKFSEIIYEIFRCNLAHGSEIPSGFEVLLRNSNEHRLIILGQQRLEIPDTIIFALLAAAVFSTVNAGQNLGKESWLGCGTMHFIIDKWWGREADAQICFSTVNAVRVTMNL
jgi:hypothetical protein